MSSSTSYFFDYMDFFKSEYFFSNRTSSVAGKMMTFSYMIVFFYLTVQAIINVLNYSDKFFTRTTSYDIHTLQNDPRTLNHLHLIAYVQVISKSGLPMSHQFRKNLLSQYFSSQVSSLKSEKYLYSKKNLLDYLCDDKSETLIFCVDFNINSIDDFIYITINKEPTITPTQFEQFFSKYSLRIHIDHYFLRSCETNFFFDLDNWRTHMQTLFPEMVKYNLFDYLVNSKSYYAESLSNINYQTGLSNSDISYQVDDLSLDTDPLFSKSSNIKALSVLQEKIIRSPNLFSFNIKMVSTRNSYGFIYLKLPQAFANVIGIMEACKFMFIVVNLLMNFLLQNLTYFDYFYTRKVKFVSGEEEEVSQLLMTTIIPFKHNTTRINFDMNLNNKIELTEKDKDEVVNIKDKKRI